MTFSGALDNIAAGRFSRRSVLRGTAALGAAGAGALVAPATVGARTGKQALVAPTDRQLALLARSLKGRLLRPGDAGYLETALVTAFRFAVAPRGIVVCANANDASVALRWAADTGVPAAVRSGGHNYAGFSTTPGLLISTAALQEIDFDASTETLTVGAGRLTGTTAEWMARTGQLVPVGFCPMVAFGGLILGGGWGAFTRQYGVVADHLVETKLVTPDGTVRICNATENTDLFWACRGGGGSNFGVNVSYTLKAYTPNPTYYAFDLEWVVGDLETFISTVNEWMLTIPREVGGEIAFAPGEPVNITGSMPIIAKLVGIADLSPASLEEVLAPLLKLPGNYLNIQLEKSAYDAVSFLDDAVPAGHFWERTRYAKGKLSSAAVETYAKWLRAFPGCSLPPDSISGLYILGGAVNDVRADATAYVHRNADFLLRMRSTWGIGEDPAVVAKNEAWIEGFFDEMAPHLLPQSYINFTDAALSDWKRAYYGSNLDRLISIKRRYNPDNQLAFAQAIPVR